MGMTVWVGAVVVFASVAADHENDHDHDHDHENVDDSVDDEPTRQQRDPLEDDWELVESLSAELWPAPLFGEFTERQRQKKERRSPAMLERADALEAALRRIGAVQVGTPEFRVAQREYVEARDACMSAPSDPEECLYAGWRLLADRQSSKIAAELFEVACEAGDDDACWLTLTIASLRAFRDEDTGQFFARACLRGDAQSCSVVRDADIDGWATPMTAACEAVARRDPNAPMTLGENYACALLVERNRHREFAGAGTRRAGMLVMIIGGGIVAGSLLTGYAALTGGGGAAGDRLLVFGVIAGVGGGIGLLGAATGLIIWFIGDGEADDFADRFPVVPGGPGAVAPAPVESIDRQLIASEPATAQVLGLSFRF